MFKFKFKRWWWSPMNRGLGLIMVHCGMVAPVDGAVVQAAGDLVAGVVTEEEVTEVAVTGEEAVEEVTEGEEVEAAVEEAAINKK